MFPWTEGNGYFEYAVYPRKIYLYGNCRAKNQVSGKKSFSIILRLEIIL